MNFSMNENIRKIKCGERTISYVLTRKKVKNVNLRIKPDGLVYISASNRVPIKFIEGFIREKSDFIFTNLDKFAARVPQPVLPEKEKIFCDGDILNLWGTVCKINIINSDTKNEKVFLNEKNIVVYSSSPERTGMLLRNFFNSEAEKIFSVMNRKTYLMFNAKGYDVSLAEIKIREMTSRWGSCHYTENKIVMNSRLVLYPEICAAYVFVHEYAHFIVPDHSERFYSVVSDIMPDYKICKRMLKY